MMKTGLTNLPKAPIVLVSLLLVISAPGVRGKESVADQAVLPTTRQLAAAIAEPSSRLNALLTVIAISYTLPKVPVTEPEQAAELETRYLDNRAWLDQLAARYQKLPSRSTILDPAAWFIQQELGQHDIVPPIRVSPLGPAGTELLGQLFDRSEERLAATLLPEVLFQTEFESTTWWALILEQAATSGPMTAFLSGPAAPQFELWKASEPPPAMSPAVKAGPLEAELRDLQALMGSALLPQPPDDLRLRRLRFNLLTAMPTMDQNQVRTARNMLYLASSIDGLHAGRYLEFIQSLLWVAADLLDLYAGNPDAQSPLPDMLAEFLPQLSTVMARNFADVDSRLNTNLAAAYDTVKHLRAGSLTTSVFDRLRKELADTVTQFVLLVPEMAFYFDQPVRRRISEEIDICISVAAVQDENGKPVMTRQQFDGCLESMLRLADTLARSTELSGDPWGPFENDQLRRELEMVPWQRINYTLGYLHQQSPPVCPVSERPLPNPLEWSALATLMTWFSTQSPVYVQTRSNEAVIVAMRQKGLDLLRILAQQIDCISGASGRFNDLVSVSVQQYREAFLSLVGGIHEADLEFRGSHLQPGADVDLGGNANQATSYRTPGLLIGPCDVSRVCEMTQQLEATRALVGQFPDEYLIADQTGLGQVEICYDNMQWIQRRAEQVRPEDPNVANYYGHLSFDLLGRYRKGEVVENVFGANFISPEEYYYLIAASSDEVLQDGCPSEWVGSRIVTTRDSGSGSGIVPNRLTYLAAARNRPSEVISANWSRGAEWRDWFVTGIGVTELEFTPDPSIGERLAQHLRALYQAEQQTIYANLLRLPTGNAAVASSPLSDLLNDLNMYKGLLRNELSLFYPEAMMDMDEVRASMEGQRGLLDETVLRRFRENNIAITQVHRTGMARLQRFQSVWKQQPEAVIRSGSVAVSVAHAVTRLNALYREFFAVTPGAALPAGQAQVRPSGAIAGSAATDR